MPNSKKENDDRKCKGAPEMICTDSKCKRPSTLLCDTRNCLCKKQHEKCFTYSYKTIYNHLKKSHKQLTEVFERSIIKLTESIIVLERFVKQLQNEKEVFTENHLSVLCDFHRRIQDKEDITRPISQKLKNFYEQFINFEIPDLKNIKCYSENEEKILKPAFKQFTEINKKFEAQVQRFWQEFNVRIYEQQVLEYNHKKTQKIKKQRQNSA